MIVYRATNTINGAVYIGKTEKSLRTRQRQHKADASLKRTRSLFHKAISKYGFEAFTWEILCGADSAGALNEAEKEQIAAAISSGIRIYNLTTGGDGGSRPGVLNHNYMKPLAEQTKQKIAESLRSHYARNPGTMTGRSRELCPQFGIPRPEEVRRKISKAKTGMQRPDIVGARNPSARPVRCLTTGEVFPIATLAASKYGADLSAIIKCCRGKVKSVKGKVYAYDSPGVFGWTVVQ